jgi:hypothetical protein
MLKMSIAPPASPPPPSSPPPELCNPPALPPPVRSESAVSSTPPLAKKQRLAYYTGSQAKKARQGTNRTYIDNIWGDLKICTCPSPRCAQLRNSPQEVDALRQNLRQMYTPEADDFANRMGGKQNVDRYLGRLLRGIPPKARPVGEYDDDEGICTYCGPPADEDGVSHPFRRCPFRAMVEEEDKAKGIPTKFEYFADAIDGNVLPRPVCAVTWKSLYGVGQDRMASIKRNYVNAPLTSSLSTFKQSYPAVRANATTELYNDRLKAILKSLELVRSHYSSSRSLAATLFCLNGSVTQKELYDMYLEEHDKAFKEQCFRMNHMPGYHRKQDEPSAEHYAQDKEGCKLTPSISYWYVRDFFSRYDIKFEALKTDTCSECARLQYLVSCGDEEAKEAQRLHLQDADTSYAEKRKDKERAKKDGSRDVTLEIDMGSGLRTPFTTIGSAYFLHMLVTSLYIVVIHSAGQHAADKTRELVYLFNEELEGKGADMVGSILANVVEHYLKPKDGQPPINRLVVWCDGTAGQVWNNALLGFFAELVDPQSPFFCALRVDVRRGPVGHTFLTCDTVAGRISQAGERHLRNSNGGGIHTTFDIPGCEVHNYVSWERVVRDLITSTYPSMKLIKLDLKDFKDVWKFIHESPTYVIPTQKSCLNYDVWLISEAREWNFGYGEVMAGGITAPHPGLVFTRKNPLQMVAHIVKIAPAAVDVKKPAADVSLALNSLRASKVHELSVKRTEKIELSWAKRKSLHTVACSMVSTSENAALIGYTDPGPDPASKSAKKKKDASRSNDVGGGEVGGGGDVEGGEGQAFGHMVAVCTFGFIV